MSKKLIVVLPLVAVLATACNQSAKTTDVISADNKPGVQAWQAFELPKLTEMAVDTNRMSSGGYRTSDMRKEICLGAAVAVRKAEDNSRPVPDEQIQQHFQAMLKGFSAAANDCVAGRVEQSWTEYQQAETEGHKMGDLIKGVMAK